MAYPLHCAVACYSRMPLCRGVQRPHSEGSSAHHFWKQVFKETIVLVGMQVCCVFLQVARCCACRGSAAVQYAGGCGGVFRGWLHLLPMHVYISKSVPTGYVCLCLSIAYSSSAGPFGGSRCPLRLLSVVRKFVSMLFGLG
jgi:hypothetical protein